MAVQRRRVDGLAASVMVLLCLIWGVQQVASKVALTEGVPPLFQALVRSVVAAPLVVAFLWWRGGRASVARLLARDGTWAPGAVIAGLFAVEFIFLFEGLRRASASRSVVILYTAAFFAAAGAHVMVPGERLRAVNVAGLVLAFAGVAATLGGGGGDSVAGQLLVLAGAAAWGFTTALVKASPALLSAPAEKVLLLQLVGSIPVLAVAAGLGGELAWPAASGLAWASLGYQCVVVAFASYLTWFWLLGRYPAGRLAAFSFLTPLFGVAAASVLLGEPVPGTLVVGLGCVVAGLWLVNR